MTTALFLFIASACLALYTDSQAQKTRKNIWRFYTGVLALIGGFSLMIFMVGTL